MQIGIGLGLTSRRLGFSPASLFATSEPGVWLDPSDLTTMFQDTAGTIPVTAPGQSVARINDKSGRGNNATQAIVASRPTYQIDGAGRGHLSFDGVDDFLVTPTVTPGIDKVQVFAGVRKLSDALTGTLVEYSALFATNNGAFRLTSVSGAPSFWQWASKGTAIGLAGGNTPAAPISAILTGLGDISGDVSTLRRNGTVSQTSTADQGTGNFLAYPIYIGIRGGVNTPFNGNIYSLIVRFGSNLPTAQIIETETWVNSKTGAF